jgi:hypothetical protein
MTPPPLLEHRARGHEVDRKGQHKEDDADEEGVSLGKFNNARRCR